ncbi:hypothetical protein SAMN04490248_12338 [Salinihabitans flavidus]|uniref:DUF1643 domain-containing protein n=1 Tax=Salinihabitans flavidus TaxID=569882 RepID=A0A1H8UZV3_9RHOB|nr:DUF1643 domain-containing protein [Salinihabitans flavidus]SEP08088.1 hypothetical protein SAMN04490248_12338 [Salinihabitans flavidus]
MITRRHQKCDAASEAVYSDCETYRYRLSRCWTPKGARVLFIMLNPSKATEAQNDPTIERCERRARRLGFGAFDVVNLFALRETDPRRLRAHPAPVGPGNDAQVTAACRGADRVIAAWGVHGAHMGRGAEMRAILLAAGAPLFHFGQTKEGHPRHPLYLPYTLAPEPWDVMGAHDFEETP